MTLPGARELPMGAVVTEPGSTRRNLTAGWRTLKPVIHDDRCIRCQLCWLYCPEGTIAEIRGDFQAGSRKYDVKYEIVYDYCKGCGICANECPTRAIEMVPETP